MFATGFDAWTGSFRSFDVRRPARLAMPEPRGTAPQEPAFLGRREYPLGVPTAQNPCHGRQITFLTQGFIPWGPGIARTGYYTLLYYRACPYCCMETVLVGRVSSYCTRALRLGQGPCGSRAQVIGRGGLNIVDHWADGPRTFAGIYSVNFPNMFVLVGPQAPAIITNVTQVGSPTARP